MRRPTSAFAKAVLGTALAATAVSAQQSSTMPTAGAGASESAPDPGAFILASVGGVHLRKPLKNNGLLVVWNAKPGIGDNHHHIIILVHFQRHGNRAVFRREFPSPGSVSGKDHLRRRELRQPQR